MGCSITNHPLGVPPIDGNRHIYIYTFIYIYILGIFTYIHYITLHYITLHYITLHYITLHTYIHTTCSSLQGLYYILIFCKDFDVRRWGCWFPGLSSWSIAVRTSTPFWLKDCRHPAIESTKINTSKCLITAILVSVISKQMSLAVE